MFFGLLLCFYDYGNCFESKEFKLGVYVFIRYFICMILDGNENIFFVFVFYDLNLLIFFFKLVDR